MSKLVVLLLGKLVVTIAKLAIVLGIRVKVVEG